MTTVVECEGAPRDLGRDQGRACAASLRTRFAGEARLLRLRATLGLSTRSAGNLHRALLRHLPRQAETLAGMASSSAVPLAWLAEQLERETRAGAAGLAAAAGPELCRSGAIVGSELSGDWIVRRSRPEGGFRCVEVTRPWLAHALLGVNEAGLAAAVSSGALAEEATGGRGPAGAPALLPAAALATDCLQRFTTLEACLDWCTARPGERPATLLFADATGEIAGIELAPGHRRVRRSAEGWLAVGGSREAREDLAKSVRETGRVAGPLAWAQPAARALLLGSERFEA